MITLSKTDTGRLCRYLKDAAKFYKKHASGTREEDRARLLLRLMTKIEKKLIKTNK